MCSVHYVDVSLKLRTGTEAIRSHVADGHLDFSHWYSLDFLINQFIPSVVIQYMNYEWFNLFLLLLIRALCGWTTNVNHEVPINLSRPESTFESNVTDMKGADTHISISVDQQMTPRLVRGEATYGQS